MSKGPYLAALDAGSGVGRCFIFDSEGHEVSSASKEWIRAWLATDWDAKGAWQALCNVIREAMKKANVSSDQIVGVSSTSLREQYILLDKKGEELRFPPDIEMFVEGGTIATQHGEKVYSVSGHWPIQGVMAPSWLSYLKKMKPNLFHKIETILNINDWMLFKLSDKRASEPAGACETCLFDVTKLRWSSEIINELEYPEHIFPAILKSGQILGEITPKAADETGLKRGTPVVIGGPDTQCGLIGSATVREGDTTAVAGTSTPVQMVLSKPIFDEKWRTWTCCHSVPSRWNLESNTGVTGWIYRWLRDEFMEAEASIARAVGVDVYEIINREVEHAPIGANGLFASLGSMIMNARASPVPIGGFFGIMPITERKVGKREMARAIIENTCYAVRGNCEQIEEISKIKIKELRFCGGAAKSTIWAKIQSEVLGVPVLVPKVKEATPLGAAICAGVGVGIYKSIEEAVDKVVRWETKIEPDSDNHEKYDTLYERWLGIYRKFGELVETADIMELTNSFLKRES